jgi:hypothetical protein
VNDVDAMNSCCCSALLLLGCSTGSFELLACAFSMAFGNYFGARLVASCGVQEVGVRKVKQTGEWAWVSSSDAAVSWLQHVENELHFVSLQCERCGKRCC